MSDLGFPQARDEEDDPGDAQPATNASKVVHAPPFSYGTVIPPIGTYGSYSTKTVKAKFSPSPHTQGAVVGDTNVNIHGGLKYPYEVGDIVYDPQDSIAGQSGNRYKIKYMRYCKSPNSGGYEVIIEVVEGESGVAASTLSQLWLPASYFFPDAAYKAKTKTSLSHYPHICPKCNAPAFWGFGQVDCSRGCTNVWEK